VASSFVAYGDDVLRNTVTGLRWTRSDNGREINWNDAKAHCERSPGWRLPTVGELRSLYDAQLPRVGCGDRVWPIDSEWGKKGELVQCRASGQFKLTGNGFWSGEQTAFRGRETSILRATSTTRAMLVPPATPARCVSGVPEHCAALLARFGSLVI
jgi:hypothetical protein